MASGFSDSAAVAAQTCRSYENNSDSERFSTFPVANLDADKHNSTGSNGLKDLRPTYAKYDHQLQINENTAYKNETADVSVTQLQTHLQDLSTDVHSGNQQGDFCSLNQIDNLERQDGEIIIYEDHSSTSNLSARVKHDTNVEQDPDHNGENIVVNKETNPVAVSECDNDDDDDNDGAPNLLPSSIHYIDSCTNYKSTMLMTSHFTTAVVGYRRLPTATVKYSDPEVNCFNTNDTIILSEELELYRHRLKKGGNGEVYRCILTNYRSNCNKQLVCKIEHKSLLYERKEEFSKLCQLRDQFLLPILAYLLERCNCGEKNCSTYVGYLIMEYLPIGDASKIPAYLKKRLCKATEKCKGEEQRMANADHRMWQKCQCPWQSQNLLIHKYQSALVKLISNAIQSTNRFHKQGLLHLDIKESNFLIRKQCNHKDVFDCECNLINFDFVLMDYDYVHEEGTVIQDPTHTGTFQYRALPLLFPRDFNMTVKANRLFDYYSLCVMIISIICGNDWCMKKLEEWKECIIKAARLRETDIKIAEEISELATSRLIADVKCLAHSLFGPTIEDYVIYVEGKLKESIKHFYGGGEK